MNSLSGRSPGVYPIPLGLAEEWARRIRSGEDSESDGLSISG